METHRMPDPGTLHEVRSFIRLRPRGETKEARRTIALQGGFRVRISWKDRSKSPDGRDAMPGYTYVNVEPGQGWTGPETLWIDSANLRPIQEESNLDDGARYKSEQHGLRIQD